MDILEISVRSVLIWSYAVLTVIFISKNSCWAYNLDTDVPIIKTGPTNSYFGFSVVQHVISYNSNPVPEPVLLVGAPLAENPGSNVQKPGAVYRCPVTARMDDCIRLKIDEDLPPDKDEDRNNQWLGVTIKSHEKGDSVVTCGHRYSRSGPDFHWGFGICYSLSSTLEYEDVYSPCVGRPVFKAHQQFGYCQAGTSLHLASNDDIVIGAPGSYTWTGALFKNNIATGIFADKRWFFSPLEMPDPVPVPHYSFLGMSAYAGHFKGLLHEQEDEDETEKAALTYVSGAPRTNGSGCVVMLDKRASNTFSTTLIPTLTLKGRDVLGEGFGYAVEGIDINADGYLDLAVGSPFYYDIEDDTVGGAVYVFLNGPNGLNVTDPVFLTGKNDSMFGYSIAAIGDINQDGFKDLAIGAPKTDNGHGAVYIFHGGSDITLINRQYPKRDFKNEEFPNSLSSLVLDQDELLLLSEARKFPDRIHPLHPPTSTPFLTIKPAQIITPSSLRYTEMPSSWDEDRYSIFSDGQTYTDDDDLETPYNKRLNGSYEEEDFEKSEIFTFGHSLSGGIDMDKNGYPDLLIGTYGSDKIYLLRSRPIINIYTEVRELPNAIDPLNSNAFPCPAGSTVNINSTTTVFLAADRKKRVDICFPVKVCFRFSAHPTSSFNTALRILYTLTAENYGIHNKRHYSRVKFLSSAPNNKGASRLNHTEKGVINNEEKSYTVSKILDLSPQISQQYVCDTNIAYLKPDTKDFLRPINFQVMVNLTNQPPRQMMGNPLININNYPIMNPDMSIKTFQVQFLKDCGDNELCESDIQLESSLLIPQGSKRNEYLMTLGQSKNVGLQVSIENFGEAAYETELFIHFSDRISYIGVKLPTTIASSSQSKSKSYSCSLFNDTLIKCEIGNPFKADGKVEFIFNFDVAGLKLENNNISFKVNVTTTSADRLLHPQNQTIRALIIIKSEMSIAGVSSPEQIFFGGFIKGESSLINEIDVGNPIEHRYMVNNNGPGTISSSYVDIMWPYEVENREKNGKWLLYMTRYPWVDGNGICEIDTAYINPLKLKLQSRSSITNLKHKKIDKKRKSPFKLKFLSDSKLRKYKRALQRTYRSVQLRFKRELIILPEPQIIAGKLRNVVRMDCQKGTAKCFTIRCQIGELAPHESVVIHLRGRLWNSTFIEDYAKMDAIAIISRANLSIDKIYNVEQNTSNDFTFIETFAYPDIDILIEFRETEPWIIIVSICLGIFLFFLIAILLWKLGFFKRKKIKPPYSARLEKLHYDDDLNDL